MTLAIKVSDLTKTYGHVVALKQVSLEVEAGKLFALLGPNGAGKTTLMRILTTQISATSGDAQVFGKSVARDGSDVRHLVSYVPQEMSVWTDITGYENLLIYAKIYGMEKDRREKNIAEALKTMELEGVADSLVSTYSGGMIRKLEIASAIMVEPKILFLDEPTIGLDPVSRKAVWEKLCSLNREKGISVFFSTHYMDEADTYADEIAVISKGAVVKTGTSQQLKQSVSDETIIVETDGAVGMRLEDGISKIKGVHAVSADGSTLKVHVGSSSIVMNPVLSFLVANKIGVKTVSAAKPTLDDVFVKYAGKFSDEHGTMAEIKRTRDRIRRT